MSKLRRRIEALEKRNPSFPTYLTMADGSIVTIDGKGDYILGLLARSINDTGATPEQKRQLDLIRQSVGIEQKGGGLMCQLVRALMLGPRDDEEWPDDPGKVPPWFKSGNGHNFESAHPAPQNMIAPSLPEVRNDDSKQLRDDPHCSTQGESGSVKQS